MPARLGSTLGEIRARLAINIGQGSQGAGVNQSLLNEFIRSAHEDLEERLPRRVSRYVWSIALGADQRWADWPTNADLDQEYEIRVDYTGSGDWFPLTEGIDTAHDSIRDHKTYPRRYDLLQSAEDGVTQIELWPTTDQAYTLEVEAIQLPSSLTLDSDRVILPTDAVLTLAVAKAKAHYKHKDWQVWEARSDRKVRHYRGAAHGNTRYVPGGSTRHARKRPVIVGI